MQKTVVDILLETKDLVKTPTRDINTIYAYLPTSKALSSLGLVPDYTGKLEGYNLLMAELLWARAEEESLPLLAGMGEDIDRMLARLQREEEECKEHKRYPNLHEDPRCIAPVSIQMLRLAAMRTLSGEAST